MNSSLKFPFYARASLIFIGLFTLISTLYLAQHIIVPIIYATIIAIVVSPLVDFFTRKKMNRSFAIMLSLVLLFLSSALLAAILYSQLSLFTDSFPKLLDKIYLALNNLVLWVSQNSNISTHKINAFLLNAKTDILSNDSINATISSVGDALVVLILIPVYVFMILFYQPLLRDFIYQLFGEINKQEVGEVLTSSKNVIQRYLLALLLEAVIIALLNATGFFIIGMDYAIVLGIIGALLNVIPYIGGIISVVLFMAIAFATKSSPSYAIWVLVVHVFIQFLDNHYIIPKIVASKVKINALISIVVVLAGGALWGIPGMFLSIPLTAILKVIFDHIHSLKPWGFLLGDTMPALTFFKLPPKNK